MPADKHIYLIGIGGSGMVWLADYALKQGWRVSGSDMVASPVTERLQSEGAVIHIGSHPESIPLDVTEVVINSAITPSSPSYPELQEAERRKLPVSKRAEFAGSITKRHYTIAVAGTHGKTTTTAMVGWILEKAGFDPTVFVGGSLKEWGGRTRIGASKYLVIEADEFDRSFHRFHPQMAVLLNIQADHLDYYAGGITEIEGSFRRFLRNLPVREGIVVGYGRDGHVRKVCRGFSYKFRWYDENSIWPGLKLRIPGMHNMLNATAAARIAHELGVESVTIQEALASFPGVGRRFEYHGPWKSVEVYDDYAHHPQEIEATMQGAREKFPKERLVAVFQPHQKSRTQLLLKDFGTAFNGNPPDELILAPVYEVAGREEDIQISNADIAAEIARSAPKGMKVSVPATNDELEEAVRLAAEQPGVLLCMGAGSIRSMVDKWLLS